MGPKYTIKVTDTDGGQQVDLSSIQVPPGAIGLNGAVSEPLGYLDLPPSDFSADRTIISTDPGKMLYHPASDANAREVTIPANSAVPFNRGTAITVVNMSAEDVTVVIDDDTLNYANVGAITTLTIPQYNQATLIKTNTTEWLASGTAGCTTA